MKRIKVFSQKSEKCNTLFIPFVIQINHKGVITQERWQI